MAVFEKYKGGAQPITGISEAGYRIGQMTAEGLGAFAKSVGGALNDKAKMEYEAISEFYEKQALAEKANTRLGVLVSDFESLGQVFGDSAKPRVTAALETAKKAQEKGTFAALSGAVEELTASYGRSLNELGIAEKMAEKRRLEDIANAELEASAAGAMEVLNAAVTNIPPVIGGREQDAYAGLRTNALILQNKYRAWDSMSREERAVFVRTAESFSKSLPLALQGTASGIQTATAEAVSQAAGEVSVLQGNKKEQVYKPGQWNVGVESIETYLAKEQKAYEAKRNAAIAVAEAQGVEHDIAPWSSVMPEVVRSLYGSVKASGLSDAEKASALAVLDKESKLSVLQRATGRSVTDWLLDGGPMERIAKDAEEFLSTESPAGAVLPNAGESIGQALVRSGLAAGTTVEKAELAIQEEEAKRKHEAGMAAARAVALSMGVEGAAEAAVRMTEDYYSGDRLAGGKSAMLSADLQFGSALYGGAARGMAANAVNAQAAAAARTAGGSLVGKVTPKSATLLGPGAIVGAVQLLNARGPNVTDEAGALITAMHQAYKGVTGEKMPREGAGFGRYGYADTDPMGQLIQEFNITSNISESKLAAPKKLGNETDAQFAVRKAKFEADRRAKIEAETKKTVELSKPVDRAEVYNRVLAAEGGPKKVAAPELRVGNITLLEKRNQGEFRNELLARTRSIFPDAPRAQVEAIADSLYSPKSELQFTPLPNGGLGMIVRDKDGSIKTVTQLEKPTDPITNAYSTGRLVGVKMTDDRGNTVGYAPMNIANVAMVSGIIPDNTKFDPSKVLNGLMSAGRAVDLAQRRLTVYKEMGDEITGKYATFYDSSTAQLVNLLIEAYGIVGVQTEQDAARTYSQTQDPSKMQDGWLKTFMIQRQYSTEQGMKMLIESLTQRIQDSAAINRLTIHGQIRPAFVGSAEDAINLNYDPNGTAVNEAAIKAEAESSGAGIMRTK